MYADAKGVPQDYAKEYEWLSLAAANGDKVAPSLRDQVAARMTNAELANAQKRASVCFQSGYKDCGP